jgi:hypothetical protein
MFQGFGTGTKKRNLQLRFEYTLLITADVVDSLTGKIETSLVQFWERESEFHRWAWLGSLVGLREWENALNELLLCQGLWA